MSIYDSPRLAAGYAYDRPPVHRHIIQIIGERLHINERPLACALDVGCGAGLSTAALKPLAEMVIGLEPVGAMLRYGRSVAPRALFVIGSAEQLPFSAEAFDLITAAGSINYADLDLFLPDAARVLAPEGVLVIYDFSAGRRFRESDVLDEWYAAFERRYPSPPGYELDVRGLDYSRSGLILEAYEELEVAVTVDINSYLPYALSETSVELAITHGVSEAEIRDWCQSTLAEVFGAESRDVLFDAYIAYARCDRFT
ncbi:MAG: methyltransferase domain-containing protein [Pyrinomonadaceae bacterium]